MHTKSDLSFFYVEKPECQAVLAAFLGDDEELGIRREEAS